MRVDELLCNIQSECALGIGNLSAGDFRLVPCRLASKLPLVTALEQISNAQVELLKVVERVAGKLAGIEDRHELGIPVQSEIRTQSGGNLICLALGNLRARGLQARTVRKRQRNRLVERDLSASAPSRARSRRLLAIAAYLSI